jgi:hypothetical protein
MIIFRNSFAAVDALSDGLRARLDRDGKKLGAVGDIGITATVAARRGDLGGVRLSIVWNLAETVAAAVSRALTSTYSSIASVY